MRYLLDTDACVSIIRMKSPKILQKLAQHSITEIAVSAITVAELQYGVQKSSNQIQNQQALIRFLLPLTVLEFDISAAAEYGRIRAFLESKGLAIGPLDTLIGSHALAQGLIVVTSNVREFSRIPGLLVEDWTQ